MMIMNLISRLIGCHKLLLLNFYTWVQRYLKPQQQNVTQILAIVAQSSHDVRPAQPVSPLVRSVIDHCCALFFHSWCRPTVWRR
jgi:protein SDA1